MYSPPLPFGLLLLVVLITLILLIDRLVKEANGVVGHRLDLMLLER